MTFCTEQHIVQTEEFVHLGFLFGPYLQKFQLVQVCIVSYIPKNKGYPCKICYPRFTLVPIIYIGENYIPLTTGLRYSGVFPLPCQPLFSLLRRFFSSSSSSAFSILFSSPCQPLLSLLRCLLSCFFGSSFWSTFSFLCCFCLIHRFDLLCWCHTKRNHLTQVHKVIWLAHAHDALRTCTNSTLTRNHLYNPWGSLMLAPTSNFCYLVVPVCFLQQQQKIMAASWMLIGSVPHCEREWQVLACGADLLLLICCWCSDLMAGSFLFRSFLSA